MPDGFHNGGILVTAKPHPFKVDRCVVEQPEGRTVAEMLEEIQPDPFLRQHVTAFIGGRIIARDYWHLVRPKAGVHLELCVVPAGGGGGKDPTRVILTIAVVATAAAISGGTLLPALQGVTFLGVPTSSLVAGGVYAAGMLAVNAIAPIRVDSEPESSQKRDSPTLSIEGVRNRARPFDPIPVVLGRHKEVPPLGAQTFTEIIGGEQFLRMLFVWGLAPLALDTNSLKINQTPLSQFEGVEIEHALDGGSVSLFSNQVFQEDLSIALTQSASWQIRTSSGGADELSVDIVFPRGLVEFNDDGNRAKRSVTIEIEFASAGSGNWMTPSFTATTVPGAWISGNSITFSQKKTAAIRHGFRWNVDPRGQYDVRVRRITADTNDSQIVDEVQWSALRSFTDEDPIDPLVPVAKTALRIKATDQLNRIIDQFSGVVTTIGKDWDSINQVWVDDQQITNPASLFRHVLQGNGSAEPLPDSRVDLEALQDFHEFCAARNFEFNMIRDFNASVWDTLADVAAAGRAAPAQIDGKWSVIIEREQPVPVSHITPRNSFDFEIEKAFPEQPDGWRIRFPNENNNYEQEERRVFNDGQDETTATKFERLDFPGVTNPDQIQRLGRFRIRQSVQQPERWTFGQDMEFLTYMRGDRVAITHDVLLVGLAYGRVKDFTVSNESITEIEVDEVLEMNSSDNYGIAIRTVAGGEVTRQLVNEIGGVTKVTLATPIDPIDGQFPVERGNIFGFGLLGQETDDASIIAIQPKSDFTARVTAVPYRPVIFDVDTETIPPFDSKITALPELPAPKVRNVTSDESVMSFGPGESLLTRIAIDFEPLSDPRLDNVVAEVQGRPSETGEPFAPMTIDESGASRVIVRGVRDGEQWDLRIRFTVSGRTPGPWATAASSHTVIGKSLPPNDVVNFAADAARDRIELSWNANPEIDVEGYEIREGPDWATGTLVTITDTTKHQTKEPSNGPWHIKAFDVVGNFSVNAAQASISVALPQVTGVRAQVIDNQVLIRWSSDVGTFDLATFEIRKGSNLDTAEITGTSDKTFDVLTELEGGEFTYWVVPIDEAGNEGTADSITVNVDDPPDFELRDQFQTDWQGFSVTALTPQFGVPKPARLSVRDFTAIEFDGVDDLVDIPDAAALDQTGSFTLEALIYSDNPSISGQRIFEKDDGTTGWALSLGDPGDGAIRFFHRQLNTISTDTPLNTIHRGLWFHVAAVFDDLADTTTIFVDGEQMVQVTGQTNAISGNGANLKLGDGYDGRISEWRLWATARTQTEIQNWKDRTLDGNETDLVAYWRAQSEGSAVEVETLSDKTPSRNDGTIIGAVRHVPLVRAITPHDNLSRDDLVALGFDTRDDMIAAGFNYRAQPVPLSAQFVEIYDAGAVIPSTRITVTPSLTNVVGTVSTSVTISIRELASDPWTDFPAGQSQIFATQFRWVKVTVDYSVGADTDFAVLDDVRTTLNVKLRDDSGRATVSANPTTISFNVDFLDVNSIVVTPQGDTSLTALVDFADAPNPASFDVWLFDNSGNAATGDVRWNARGT